MTTLTHMDEKGRVRMVDVTDKAATRRKAVAGGTVFMSPATLDKILSRDMAKGNVLETARIAGVMAAKRTGDLIPMCHPLNITHVAVDFEVNKAQNAVHITAAVQLTGSTGVEMEAFTAVTVAALTLYDMCKAVDKEMVISNIRLLEKSGGKSGTFRRRNSSERHG